MEAERLSRLALSYDRFDPLALSLCGHIRSWLFHDYDHAIELFDRALAANPSAAIAWARWSATFSYIGETREARRRVEIGLRLSPYDAHVFFSYGLAGLAAYAGGDYAEAASWGRRAMTLNPRFVGNLRFLAASLAASGQFKEAHEVGRALLRVNPSVQRRQVRGRACVQGCRQAAAVRRAPGAGGAAGVAVVPAVVACSSHAPLSLGGEVATLRYRLSGSARRSGRSAAALAKQLAHSAGSNKVVLARRETLVAVP